MNHSLLPTQRIVLQMVFISSNLGLLSAACLSIEALLHPLSWQCMLAPILPDRMSQFIEAPVPFAVGMQSGAIICVCFLVICGSGVKKLRSAERVHIFLDYDEVTAPEGCSSYLPKWSQLFTSLEPHYESLRALAQATSQPLSNSNIMLEAQPLLSKCLEVFKNFTECAAEVAFMMERTRSNPFGELQSDPKNIDPFYKSFLATQAWAVYRDETLMNARVPVHCLTPRARKEREEFDRQRELREANEQGA